MKMERIELEVSFERTEGCAINLAGNMTGLATASSYW